MKQNARGLFNRLISTRQFLFSRPSAPLEGHSHRLSSLPASDPLIQAFPDILVGQAFATAALEKAADWDTFGTMAMYIEPGSEQADDPGALPGARLALARVLAQIIRGGDGIWGVLDPHHLGCFLPGDSVAGLLESARGIQHTLSEDSGPAVTVGAAVYPTVDFDRDDILSNAFKALDHAEFFGPGSRVAFDAVSLNISGDKRYDAGDIEGAAEEYRKGLLLDPDNVNLHNSLGVCYGVMSEFDKALGEFAAATRLNDREVMAVYNTGLIHILRKEMEEGKVHLEKAETIDNGVFEVALQLGRVCLEGGDLQKSDEYLQKARALNPQSTTVHFFLGECFSAMKREKQAVSAYQNAIKIDPYNAAALSALGWLYHQRNENRDIARLFCEQSVKIAPDNPLFCFRLGRLYLAHGRMEEAVEALRAAARLGYNVDGDLEEIRRLTTAGDSIPEMGSAEAENRG